MSNKNESILTDDIEVVGPGQMLAEARIALKLTQEEVANKLNFKLSLVKDIENEIFDKSLPETFNRGYLKSFAKLVATNPDDVIASYEMLDIAEKQCAEMQSFSKLTKKQAENNRIMWITYLIIAIIVGSTLVWLFQAQQQTVINIPTQNTNENKLNTSNNNLDTTNELVKKTDATITNVKTNTSLPDLSNTSEQELADDTNLISDQVNEIPENLKTKADHEADSVDPIKVLNITHDTDTALTNVESQSAQISQVIDKTTVVFTFKGDSWVNIFDSTGERIAWGVKKADYIMTIEGVAPFSITLGKPERVLINYDGSDLDMSQFNRGNIAKFTLPLSN